MKLRIRNHLLFFYHYKTIQVYGISSKVKNSDEHYLLFDVDDDVNNAYLWLQDHYENLPHTEYPTHKGFHYIVFKPQSWTKTLKELMDCPYVDKTWIALAIRRGYLFLQTYVKVPHRAGLTYMRVERLA